jgi:hypothetical protein
MRVTEMTDAETQLAGHFAKYEPAMIKLGKALRAKLKARLPGLFEIVYMYENQDALVLSYSPTGRGFEAVCSISVTPDAVKLGFGKGAELAKSDPNKLLQGSGKTARYVELNSVAAFERGEVQALIAAAVKLAKLRLDPDAKGAMIVKADEQKRRAHRAARPTKRTKASAKKKATKSAR